MRTPAGRTGAAAAAALAPPGTGWTTGTEMLAAPPFPPAELPRVTVTGAAAGRAGGCGAVAREGAARGLSKPGGSSDSGEDWAKAQELGRGIDPDNPLYHPGGAPLLHDDGGPERPEPMNASTDRKSVV